MLCYVNRLIPYVFVSLLFFASTDQGHTSLPSNMKDRMDDWVDPKFMHKRDVIESVLDDLTRNGNVVNPPRKPENPNEDYGFSYYADSRFDFLCINRIQAQRIACLEINETKRIPILDLGCGCMANMTTLAVLAGGMVDAVDFKETLTLANKRILQATRKVIGYETADAKQYYRLFPSDLTSKLEPNWAKEPHVIAILKDVVHFMIES
jgi:hypothetical protein